MLFSLTFRGAFNFRRAVLLVAQIYVCANRFLLVAQKHFNYYSIEMFEEI